MVVGVFLLPIDFGAPKPSVGQKTTAKEPISLGNDRRSGYGLTTIVLRKRSRWSIETLFRDAKQFSGLAAGQCRTDQALVLHVAFVLLAFILLQRFRQSPKEISDSDGIYGF